MKTLNAMTFEISDQILKAAEQITLRDVMDCPFTQPWAISLICNALHSSHNFEMEEEADELLELRLHKINNRLDPAKRQALFSLCHQMIVSRQERKKRAEELKDKGMPPRKVS